MRILFDQGTPIPIRNFLTGHTVQTAADLGWSQMRNGDLLNAAEAAGFELLLTTDRNLRYQQSLAGRKIAILVLSRQQWPHVRPHVQLIVAAINEALAGTFKEIEIPS